VWSSLWLNLDETEQQIDEVAELAVEDADVETPNERERRRPEISLEDLNDDDVDVDDRLDVASLGDGSDDEIIKSVNGDDYAGSPFSRDVIVQPVNPSNDLLVASRSALFDDQVGSLIFTNQVRRNFISIFNFVFKHHQLFGLFIFGIVMSSTLHSFFAYWYCEFDVRSSYVFFNFFFQGDC